MPGQPPPNPDDRAMLYALPEDQPDRLSEGHKSNQADLDATPAEKAAGTATDEVPNQSANKADWEAYAASKGIDTEGMTKDEIIAASG